MIPAHKPADHNNVKHTLMIGHNDQGFVLRYLIFLFKATPVANYVETTHEAEVENINGNFMSLVTSDL